MSKKVTISLILTLVVAMLTSSLVLAADPTATAMNRPGIRIGIIQTVSHDKITLKNAAGQSKTILLSSSTRFVKINGDEKDKKDLAKGQWVMVIGTLNANRELEAQLVVLATRRINMGAWSAPRQFGRVASVEAKAGTFRLFAPHGFFTFKVDSSTHFFGTVKSLSALKDGMTVILSFKQSGGVMTVRSMLALP